MEICKDAWHVRPNQPTPPRPAVPEPTLTAAVAGVILKPSWQEQQVEIAKLTAALGAERRRAELAEERYDKTFHFFNVMESERDQMEAQRDALAAENRALRREVAGLRAGLEDAAETLEQYDGDLARGHAAEIRAFLEKQP